ncbi:MAG: hypothetical protein U9M89_01115 [Patescibacteria group bacterium]|nr:hypothetical protein [Patescibacteria group bacterium]
MSVDNTPINVKISSEERDGSKPKEGREMDCSQGLVSESVDRVVNTIMPRVIMSVVAILVLAFLENSGIVIAGRIVIFLELMWLGFLAYLFVPFFNEWRTFRTLSEKKNL